MFYMGGLYQTSCGQATTRDGTRYFKLKIVNKLLTTCYNNVLYKLAGFTLLLMFITAGKLQASIT